MAIKGAGRGAIRAPQHSGIASRDELVASPDFSRTQSVDINADSLDLQNADGAVWFEWGTGPAVPNQSLLLQASHPPIGKPPTETNYSVRAYSTDVPLEPITAAVQDYR